MSLHSNCSTQNWQSWLALLLAGLFALSLNSCGPAEVEQPSLPWTYPIQDYDIIKSQAARRDGNETRLVGWDKSSYFFDWSRNNEVIRRMTGRIERKEFDLANNGALTLQKGKITVRNGQIRNVAKAE